MAESPYDARIKELSSKTIESDGVFGKALAMLRAQRDAYFEGIAEAEVKWKGAITGANTVGFRDGVLAERAKTAALVLAVAAFRQAHGLKDNMHGHPDCSCDACVQYAKALTTYENED